MQRKLSQLILFAFLLLLPARTTGVPQDATSPEIITIDANVKSQPFPHFWEQMFGSGRAILSLREDYRQDLRAVKTVTDFKYVRFHDVLDDDVGVFDLDENGKPIYNFSYVDQIYDGLLKNGVRPYVELSFMPGKLAARDARQAFWYHPIVSPPKDWNLWGDLVRQFAEHLVKRYGIDEVSHWYFEVWNEPNIDFWGGEPKQQTYFELYDHAARAIKQVSPRLLVGGPATAQAAWVDAFIHHAVEDTVPVDFVSTHVYGNDTAENVFGTKEVIPRDRMVCRAAKKVHEEVKASARPRLPVIFSEYNASYKNEPDVTDSIFMGPWLADTIRQCDGLVEMLSYWTFSDVFDEQGVIQKPFYGGFGLVAGGGIPKPAFNAFQLLHMLGDQRIPVDSNSALATKRSDGSLAIAVWNYSPPQEMGAPRQITLTLNGLAGGRHAEIYRLDWKHGNVLPAYAAMGSPASPTPKQIQKLKSEAALPPPESMELSENQINLTLPPKGLDLIVIR
jgi:xylan 1,4-beta-xylosidase